MRNLIHNATPMLLCVGDVPHVASFPEVRGGEGATGPVVCTECGAGMILVDVITVDRDVSWSSISFDRRQVRRYYS